MAADDQEIYQKCIDASSAAAVACLKCTKSIKKEQNPLEKETITELLFACAAVCLLNLKSLATESEFLNEVCNNCEQICMQCEEECGKFADLAYFKNAAIACGICAAECKIITEM